MERIIIYLEGAIWYVGHIRYWLLSVLVRFWHIAFHEWIVNHKCGKTLCYLRDFIWFYLFFIIKMIKFSHPEYIKHAACLRTVHSEYVKCGNRHQSELAALMADHNQHQQNGGETTTMSPMASTEQITQNLAHLCGWVSFSPFTPGL